MLSAPRRANDLDVTSQVVRAAILAVVFARKRDPAALPILRQLGRLMRQYDAGMQLMIVPPGDRELLVAAANSAGDPLLAYELADTFLVPSVTNPIRPVPKLTPRERTVLAELALPGTSADIAERLQVSVNTVHTQLRSLYRKLELASREEALRAAIGHGLLDLGENSFAGTSMADTQDDETDSVR